MLNVWLPVDTAAPSGSVRVIFMVPEEMATLPMLFMSNEIKPGPVERGEEKFGDTEMRLLTGVAVTVTVEGALSMKWSLTIS